MLPRLMDQVALKSACGLESSEFANAATLGMLPRACGTLNGVPLWLESDARKFASEVGKPFNEEWTALSVTLSSSLPKSAPELAPDVLERKEQVWPEEMLQATACRYLDVSPSFLQPHMDSGLLNFTREGRKIIYRKSDLDAFMQLPQYTRRIRRTRNKIHAVKPAEQLQPRAIKMPDSDAKLSEKGAADHLGIHYGVLALSRKYGTGPVCVVDSSGAPRYRVADLDAFAAQHLKNHQRDDVRARSDVVKTTRPDGTQVSLRQVAKPGEAATPPPASESIAAAAIVMDNAPISDEKVSMEQIAERFGVNVKSIENWRTRGVFAPEPVGRVKHETAVGMRSHIVFNLSDVIAWEAQHGHNIEKARRMIAEHATARTVKATKTPAHGRVNGKKKVLGATRKAPAKAAPKSRQPVRVQTTRATLGGGRVRH